MADALAAHEEVLAKFGGRPGILSRDLLESAIARPYCGYYRSIAEKGAALVQSVACNHAFSDGNKRTAVLMLGILLSNSGYALKFANSKSANKEVEQMVLDLVNHQLQLPDVIDWIRR